ncbi:hypothetical protein CSB93_2469 [Pseudomonas paraeruginosa]|uniref:Uncharacterized protein n=1 Tax=Pseudomonas paraeruginosa TaxID=2994495 RepID=A0A2R3IWE8_9PSED|nr:hypothetical protein CSB93_2469 [Pseudomonas paraeruginosa]AWE93950.1 hypothetical protein CSC28_1237 [Pseudomonas paraeruginosa]PTC38158.1 hypothetical protein CLJ1_1056 [Pseudomonas aeruginosa]
MRRSLKKSPMDIPSGFFHWRWQRSVGRIALPVFPAGTLA